MSNYLVAGGSHGIGLGLVKCLLERDHKVTVLSRTAGDLNTLDVQHIECDLTAEEFNLDDVPSNLQGIAYCPGTLSLRPMKSLKAEVFLSDFELNVLGAVRLLQALLPSLKTESDVEKTKSVLFFSTVAVGKGIPAHASVAASKGAVEGLARTLAAEWAPDIRVNCLAPALTETPLTSRFFSSDAKAAALSEMYPLKRTGTVDDLATAATFLLTPDSDWITGQVLAADGGMSVI
ncbi:MAG: SDR family NAD(P)-dependent oxidoreductase [Rubripirellula sp.]